MKLGIDNRKESFVVLVLLLQQEVVGKFNEGHLVLLHFGIIELTGQKMAGGMLLSEVDVLLKPFRMQSVLGGVGFFNEAFELVLV